MNNIVNQLRSIQWLSISQGINRTFLTLFVIITLTIIIFGINVFATSLIKWLIETILV